MICNVGILGPGFVATRAVLPALQRIPRAHLFAVASRDRERAQRAAKQFGIERIYDDYQALLDDREVDAVYIALPNHLHHLWTLRAAEAGKHVLCEKPLALNGAECDEMIAACQQAKVVLMEAVMYRFHPRMIYLKQMLVNGELGATRFLHLAFTFPFNAPDNYRAQEQYGGGALLDVGSYCIHAARWLTDAEPRYIQGMSRKKAGIDVDTQALLGFDGSVIAHIQCSFAAAEHQVIEVVGSTGVVTAPLAFTAWTEDSTTLHLQRGSHVEQRLFAAADPYEAMAAHFVDCVLGQATLSFAPTDSRGTLEVIDQLRKVCMELYDT